MDRPSDPGERLHDDLDQERIKFLELDLDMCFAMTDLAATRLKSGNGEDAEKAIADAEKGYQTVSRFLNDPKHMSRMTADEIRRFTAELQRLRERLDGLRGR